MIPFHHLNSLSQLALTYIFVLATYAEITHAGWCFSGAEYFRDGTFRVFRTRKCSHEDKRSKWCTKALYGDTDVKKLRGWTKGCDTGHCVAQKEAGLLSQSGCTNTTEMGNLGLMCCCQGDLCNGAGASREMFTWHCANAVAVPLLVSVWCRQVLGIV